MFKQVRLTSLCDDCTGYLVELKRELCFGKARNSLKHPLGHLACTDVTQSACSSQFCTQACVLECMDDLAYSGITSLFTAVRLVESWLQRASYWVS